jgi:hypothetical protein
MKTQGQRALAAVTLVVVIAATTYFSGHTQPRTPNASSSISPTMLVEKPATTTEGWPLRDNVLVEDENAKIAEKIFIFSVVFLICASPGLAVLLRR